MTETDSTDLRREWERQWGRRRDHEFEWSLATDVAPQLKAIIEGGRPWSGRALDVGCGAGASTSYLGSEFDSAVGVDIALAALRQAVDQNPVERGGFSAADALSLPFPDGTFSLGFDRGCLQNLGKQAWPGYFREIDRVLADGGRFILLVSRMTAEFPPLLSKRGARRRWAWYVQRKRGGAQFLTHDFLRQVCTPQLRIDRMEDFDFQTKKKKIRRFTHAELTKVSR